MGRGEGDREERGEEHRRPSARARCREEGGLGAGVRQPGEHEGRACLLVVTELRGAGPEGRAEGGGDERRERDARRGVHGGDDPERGRTREGPDEGAEARQRRRRDAQREHRRDERREGARRCLHRDGVPEARAARDRVFERTRSLTGTGEARDELEGCRARRGRCGAERGGPERTLDAQLRSSRPFDGSCSSSTTGTRYSPSAQ